MPRRRVATSSSWSRRPPTCAAWRRRPNWWRPDDRYDEKEHGMTLKVIQWATGGLGQAAIGHIGLHPDLELVGCWVHSAEKAGKDVGEILGGEPIGVIATND